MRQFFGNHVNRIDSKGRVSIPASFRASLRDAEGNTALILRPAAKPFIEGWPVDLFQGMASKDGEIDPFDEVQQKRMIRFFAKADTPQVDKEGRMGLPEKFVRHANITTDVMFIGLGRWFQIWEPAAGEAWLAEADAS